MKNLVLKSVAVAVCLAGLGGTLSAQEHGPAKSAASAATSAAAPATVAITPESTPLDLS